MIIHDNPENVNYDDFYTAKNCIQNEFITQFFNTHKQKFRELYLKSNQGNDYNISIINAYFNDEKSKFGALMDLSHAYMRSIDPEFRVNLINCYKLFAPRDLIEGLGQHITQYENQLKYIFTIKNDVWYPQIDRKERAVDNLHIILFLLCMANDVRDYITNLGMLLLPFEMIFTSEVIVNFLWYHYEGVSSQGKRKQRGKFDLYTLFKIPLSSTISEMADKCSTLDPSLRAWVTKFIESCPDDYVSNEEEGEEDPYYLRSGVLETLAKMTFNDVEPDFEVMPTIITTVNYIGTYPSGRASNDSLLLATNLTKLQIMKEILKITYNYVTGEAYDIFKVVLRMLIFSPKLLPSLILPAQGSDTLVEFINIMFSDFYTFKVYVKKIKDLCKMKPFILNGVPFSAMNRIYLIKFATDYYEGKGEQPSPYLSLTESRGAQGEARGRDRMLTNYSENSSEASAIENPNYSAGRFQTQKDLTGIMLVQYFMAFALKVMQLVKPDITVKQIFKTPKETASVLLPFLSLQMDYIVPEVVLEDQGQSPKYPDFQTHKLKTDEKVQFFVKACMEANSSKDGNQTKDILKDAKKNFLMLIFKNILGFAEPEFTPIAVWDENYDSSDDVSYRDKEIELLNDIFNNPSTTQFQLLREMCKSFQAAVGYFYRIHETLSELYSYNKETFESKELKPFCVGFKHIGLVNPPKTFISERRLYPHLEILEDIYPELKEKRSYFIDRGTTSILTSMDEKIQLLSTLPLELISSTEDNFDGNFKVEYYLRDQLIDHALLWYEDISSLKMSHYISSFFK